MNTNTNSMADLSTTELEQIDGGGDGGCTALFAIAGTLAGGLGGGPAGAGAGLVWGLIWAEAVCN